MSTSTMAVSAAIEEALRTGEIEERQHDALLLFLQARGAAAFPADLGPGTDWQGILDGSAEAVPEPIEALLSLEVFEGAPDLPPGTDLPRHEALFHLTRFEPLGAVQELRLQAFEASNIVASNALERANELQEALDELGIQFNDALTNLATLIVTQQTEIENSIRAQADVEEAAGEGGLRGFLGRAVGFVAAPFSSLFDAIGGWFLGEVRDGLNR